MPSGFQLIVIAGKHAGQRLDVPDSNAAPVKIGRTDDRGGQDENLIGRRATPDRDLLLDDDTLVSRGHARIEAVSNGYVVVDCGSANGTRVDGKPLRPRMPMRLRDGAELELGSSRVRFELCRGETFIDPRRPTWSAEAEAEEQHLSSGDTPHSRFEPRRAPEPPPPPPVDADEPVAAEASGSIDTPAIQKVSEPPPRENFGPYAIYDSLSRGAVTSVDVAIHANRSGQKLALKRFQTRALSAGGRRLLEESAARARKWDHPGILAIVDHGEESGFFYLASPLLDGRCLRDLQKEHASEIDVGMALYVSRAICAALRHAQSLERGFTWKNLTPQNVFLTSSGEVVLLNFGIPSTLVLTGDDEALLADPEAPHVCYLSPEQRAKRPTDARSDIYSAGVILYELLLQKPVDPKRRVLLEIDLVRPVPREVAEATSRAVSYQPAQRFLHPAEMEEAIAAALQKVAPDYGPEAAATWIAAHL